MSALPPKPFATWLDWAVHWDARNYTGEIRLDWANARAELASLRARADRADALAEALAAAERVVDALWDASHAPKPLEPAYIAAFDEARAALAAAKARLTATGGAWTTRPTVEPRSPGGQEAPAITGVLSGQRAGLDEGRCGAAKGPPEDDE